MCEPDLSETAEVSKLGSKASFIEILTQVTGSLPEPKVSLLQKIWAPLLGEELAHRTRPVAIEKNEIRVETDARWVDSMRTLAPQMLRKINHGSPWTFKRLNFVEGEFEKVIQPISGAEPFSFDEEEFAENMTRSKCDLEELDKDLQGLASSILKHIIHEK